MLPFIAIYSNKIGNKTVFKTINNPLFKDEINRNIIIAKNCNKL